MKTPLVRPVPYSDESPGSVLIRATQYNGWRSPSAFLNSCGFQINQSEGAFIALMSNKERWKDACEVLGVTDLATTTCYQRTGLTKRSTVEFMGMETSWASLSLSESKLCPICVKEKPYLLKKWDHKLVTCCTKHGVDLIDYCPECRGRVRWNRKDLSSCACGYELIEAQLKKTQVDSVKYVENLFQKNDVVTINELLLLLSAISEVFEFVEMEREKNFLVSLTVQSKLGINEAIKNLTKIVNNYIVTCGIHPRIVVMPLLELELPLANRLAIGVLANVSPKLKKRMLVGKTTKNKLECFVKMSRASSILGVSKHLTKLLIESDALIAERKSKKCAWSVSLLSLNDLLMVLSKGNSNKKSLMSIKTIIQSGFINQKVTALVNNIIDGEYSYKGMDLGGGLLTVKVQLNRNTKPNRQYVNMNDVAKLCGVHYENIRFAVHAGVLKRIDPNKTPGTTIFIAKRVAEEFICNFIFSGELAKKHNCNPTNLAEKIKAGGVKPVSGPGIDGGLTYLFKRKEVEKLDFDKIVSLESYTTKTGRKKGRLKSDHSKHVPVSMAERLLKIDKSEVLKLLRGGVLKEKSTLGRSKRVSRRSINQLIKIQNDKGLVTVGEASSEIKESMSQFHHRWISSGFIEVIDAGLEKYVSKTDLQKIKKMKRIHMTAEEVGELFGTNRSYASNLEKMKLLKPSTHLISRGRKIKFYRRSEIDQYLLNLSPIFESLR